MSDLIKPLRLHRECPQPIAVLLGNDERKHTKYVGLLLCDQDVVFIVVTILGS